ncbi:MipA/OmpV family protein [Yoonia sp. R2331]|uniref:MipA/OmpV family protein n=1 Tax=Yoonia sp. R2331 TaxID=3237238 RepID=UPI0034E4ACCA
MRHAILALVLTGSAATAQDGPAGIAFELGIGAQSAPGYFGSDSNQTGPTGSFALDRFTFGSLGTSGEDKTGLGVTGSFRYIGARTSDDYAELTGLNDIDAALEVGGGVTYTGPNFEVYAVARRGLGGHEGYVGELGGDLIFYPSQAVTLRVGPRLLAGDDDYAGTYFGVTAAEAAASSFSAFEASGGAMSRGVEISADYALTSDWGLTGTLRYDELLNDAARSPITQSADQVTVGLVVTRDFSFGF